VRERDACGLKSQADILPEKCKASKICQASDVCGADLCIRNTFMRMKKEKINQLLNNQQAHRKLQRNRKHNNGIFY